MYIYIYIYQEVAVRLETEGSSCEGYLTIFLGTAHDRASIDPKKMKVGTDDTNYAFRMWLTTSDNVNAVAVTSLTSFM
jgi:hypothetical protein